MIDPTAFIHDSAVVLGTVTLGARASVWPTAVIRADADHIEIGEDTNIQDGAIIGRGSLVGSGAVVTEGTVIPPDSLVLGVPARVVRALTPELRERVAAGHVSYSAMKDRHRAGEFPRHR